LLDKSRTPVLKALLKLNRASVLDNTISAETFARYASPTIQCNFPGEELDLRAAALFLGNVEAFICIEGKHTDLTSSTLHTASMLALPELVQWLLDQGHNPNAGSDEYPEPLIPLAIVCGAQYQPWCKIANEQVDFETRRLRTMQILVQATDISWRYKGKSVLHFALDYGSQVTEAMITALNIKEDPAKEWRYLYTDRDGVEYSPHMYVKDRMGLGNVEKNVLLKCLKKANMSSRHFRRKWYAAGTSQPTGAHGLPSAIAAHWNANGYNYSAVSEELVA
jgi:hypothetical protein